MKLSKVGRKFAALYLMSAIVLVAGWTVTAAKVAAVITGLVAMFTAAVTGHSMTDIAATKAIAQTPPAREEEGS